jgi:hypothetical protein
MNNFIMVQGPLSEKRQLLEIVEGEKIYKFSSPYDMDDLPALEKVADLLGAGYKKGRDFLEVWVSFEDDAELIIDCVDDKWYTRGRKT